MPHFAYIIIIAFVVILASVIRIAIKSRNRHFECPDCGAHFQLGFFKMFFTVHGMGSYEVKCPVCGKHNMLSPVEGKS